MTDFIKISNKQENDSMHQHFQYLAELKHGLVTAAL